VIQLKSLEEIEKIRSAGRILRSALTNAGESTVDGVTTAELDEIVRRTIIEAGAKAAFKGYQGFPGNACISVNEEVVHGIPGNRILHDGDIVSIDIGVYKDDFFADACETFAVGKPSETAGRLMAVTLKSLERGIEQCRPGNRLGDISHAVQIYVEANDFSVVRDLVGHGIGRNLHEDPQVPNFGPAGQGPLLRAGMVLAIEPMVNEGRYDVRTLSDEWTVVTADGKLSAHYEHSVAITEDGPEILTDRI
jgi:methionyl aminopeptidase